MLQFMGSQRVGHDWATELNWTELIQPIDHHLIPGNFRQLLAPNKDFWVICSKKARYNLNWDETQIWYHSQCVKLKALVAQLCPTLHDPMDSSPSGPLSMEFSRHEYWSRLPFPSPGDLPTQNEPQSPVSPALAGVFFTVEPPGKPHRSYCM